MIGIALGSAVVAGVALGFPAVGVAVVLAVALAAWRRELTPMLCAVILAALVGAWRAEPAAPVARPDWIDQATALRGEVVTGPVPSGNRQRFDLAVSEVRTRDGWRPASGRACIFSPIVPRVGRGDRLFLSGAPEAVEDQSPGFASYLRFRGCSALGTAFSMTILEAGGGWRRLIDDTRRAMTDRLSAAAPGDAGALLSGLVTGDDGALSPERREAFVATGTSHVTAVSGSNVALVVAIAAAAGAASGLRRRFTWQIVTAAGVWAYALLVQLGPPSLRAALVATGAVFASRFGRRPDFVTLIVLAAAIELLARPADFWSLSFRLSLASALAMAIVLPSMKIEGAFGWLRAGYIGTTVAQLATLPVLLPAFGRLALLTVPANLLIAPAVALAFPLSFFAAAVGAVAGVAGQAALIPAVMLADYIFAVVETLGGNRFSLIPIGVPSAGSTVAVSLLSVGAILSLSRDGRAVSARGVRAAQRAPGLLIVGAVGAAAGVAMGVVGAWTLR